MKRTAKNAELRQQGEIENEGRFGLKSLVRDPRTQIELSVEDTLDVRAFGSTPKHVNQTTGGVFDGEVLDRKCRIEQVQTKVKGESCSKSNEWEQNARTWNDVPARSRVRTASWNIAASDAVRPFSWSRTVSFSPLLKLRACGPRCSEPATSKSLLTKRKQS
jgi:hypothetical protein